jgi:DNA-binding response OmpR family regulator
MRAGLGGTTRLGKATGFVIASDARVCAAIDAAARTAGVGRIESAGDSAAAFSDLLRLRPDFLFVDLAAQPLDGFAFAHLVRNAGGGRVAGVPILLVAEQVTSAQVSNARNVRADVLLRPLDPLRLRARLLLHLDGQTPFAGAVEV